VVRSCVLGFVLAVLVGGCGTGGSGSGGDGEQAARPAEIVAALGRRVVVLSSDDGSVVRTLADDQQGATRVAVSPDRETVYFTRSNPDVLCDEGLASEIVSVPVAGGSPQIVASGQGAVLSPDGTRIAYATGGANQCGPANQLAIQELGTDTFSQELFEGGDATIVPLTWSPDSRRVLYSAQTPDDVQAREVEPGTGAPPRTVPVPDGAYLPTYLGDSESVAVVRDEGTDARVLEIDAATGEEGRTLFELADRPAFRSLVADPSGRHLLFTTLAGDTGGDRIWRWADGRKPVVVLETSDGNTAEDAVWLVAPTAS
jgi:dipeptidyl aminopeptidase/acylaminoacyl peptidase